MAIGARPVNILRLVLRQGGGLTAAGLALGLALAFASTRLLSGLLVGISATDPLVFIAAPVLLAVVAVVAAWVPMRQVLRIDPLQVLRQE